MSRTPSAKPDEARLLAYVEDLMSSEEVAEFEQEYSSQPQLLAALDRLRLDRSELQAMGGMEAPAGLTEDVLGVVERSFLLSGDQDPLAPPVNIRRGSTFNWTRYGAAAAFVLLLSGTLILVAGNLWFKTPDTGIGDGYGFDPNADLGDGATHLVQGDGPEGEGSGIDGDALADADAGEGLEDPGPGEVTADALADAGEEASESTEVLAEVMPTLVTQEAGLAYIVQSGDPRRTIAHLASALESVGGCVVYNGAHAVTGEETEQVGPNRMAHVNGYLDLIPGAFEGAGGLPDPSELLDPAGPGDGGEAGVGFDVLDIICTIPGETIPADIQADYYESGFEFTLIGTPTDMRELLRALRLAPDHLVIAGRDNDGRTLEDFIRPPHPRGRQWRRAIIWWNNAAEDLPLARQAAAAMKPEPILRLPIRLSQRDSLKPRNDDENDG